MSKRYNKVPELTAEKAYKHYHNDGLSYKQIAEKYSSDDESISHTTVRNRVNSFDEGVSTVTSNPEEYDLKSAIDDNEPEDNPFDKVEYPCCGERQETPNSPGKHSCPNCGVVLEWNKSEL